MADENTAPENSVAENSTFDEQRKFPRVKTDVKVGILQSNGKMAYARIKNLSLGGIYVQAEYSADKGKKFQVEFSLSIKEKMYKVIAKCKVVYIHYGSEEIVYLGMGFVKFKDDGKEKISEYIQTRL